MFCKRLHKSGDRLSHRQSGQALLELAVFGSLILMVLGAIVSYGLRFNFQQQADMHVFRKAQELAMKHDNDNQPYGSSSYTVVRDRHLPDASNPFGIGGVSPVMASASITRDNRLDETAMDYDGLPKMVINFQSSIDGQLVEQEKVYATAGLKNQIVWTGFWSDTYYEEVIKGKYGLVYGSVGNWCEYRGEDEWEKNCKNKRIPIRILDSVEGEVFDYESAVSQARLIVDQGYCVSECDRQRKAGEDYDYSCDSVCSYPIPAPWYVAGAYEHPQTGEWVFPEIDQMLVYPGVGKPIQALGLQQDSVQHTETDFRLDKSEDDDEIRTTDNVFFSTVTTRNLIFNDHLSQPDAWNQGGGFVIAERNLQVEQVVTNTTDTRSFTWETPWQD